MHKVRLWMYASKTVIILPFIIVVALIVVGIVIAIISNTFVGIFISVLFSIIFFLVFCLNSYIVEIEQDVVKEKSFLGKLKKKNCLKNLTKIKLLTLYGDRRGRFGYTANFFVLYFSDREEDFRYIDDAREEDDIIVFERTKKTEAILKRYTNLPIEDKSELKKKNLTKNGEEGSQ